MKLINSVGPNPHVVRMFAAEKGIDLPMEDIDIMAGVNRQPDYLAKNPTGGAPCLQLDNGDYLSEITAICEYLEEKYPETPLIGTTAEERAEARMWARRVDLYINENLANGFRYSEGLDLFKDRITTLPEAAEGLKSIAQEKITWLDGLIDGREFIAGDRLTLADVLLYCFLTFGISVGQPLNENNKNIAAWYERMAARPSAQA
ncbi:MAG: glutathione S-transferase family protein [Gammaproteobacteria bacterium]|nr:MAG: glutathione S-transferase family protein [Gammaproteobacteria bacterium]